MGICDKWLILKIFEVLFCIACLVCKRVTDDESIRLALYLQKLSREWSLLRNITWDSIGAAFGDAVYGGYLIITIGLLLAKIFGEVPRGARVLEGFLLGLGALFFIILGALELASLDSIPNGLIDNAAVLGVLSLITAALFLFDLAGPRTRKTNKHSQTNTETNVFTYPNLRQENTVTEVRDIDQTDLHDEIISPRPKLFPDKFKKNKDEGRINKTEETNGIRSKSTTAHQVNERDEDSFLPTENIGYRGFSDEATDVLQLEEVEKTKFGSVRNGDIKHSTEEKLLKKVTIDPKEKRQIINPDSLNGIIRNVKEHEEEMNKNISYLKLLDEKSVNKQKLEKTPFEEDLAKLNEQYMREYHNMVKINENNSKNFPRMGLSRNDYDKRKHWETFEEENLPRFPVKEEYLPELQTPVFAKIKEKNNSNKGYGIYDNLSLYNIQGRSDTTSQNGSIRSKTSTLRASKPPTLQQIAEYFGLQQKSQTKTEKKEASVQIDSGDLPGVSFMLPTKSNKNEAINSMSGPSSPTDPGYVQYTAQHWNDRLNRNYSTRTPRHSPTE